MLGKPGEGQLTVACMLLYRRESGTGVDHKCLLWGLLPFYGWSSLLVGVYGTHTISNPPSPRTRLTNCHSSASCYTWTLPTNKIQYATLSTISPTVFSEFTRASGFNAATGETKCNGGMFWQPYGWNWEKFATEEQRQVRTREFNWWGIGTGSTGGTLVISVLKLVDMCRTCLITSVMQCVMFKVEPVVLSPGSQLVGSRTRTSRKRLLVLINFFAYLLWCEDSYRHSLKFYKMCLYTSLKWLLAHLHQLKMPRNCWIFSGVCLLKGRQEGWYYNIATAT